MIRSRVREWVQRHALLPHGGNIVAACSGGPDSLALVDLLDGFRQELKISLFVAHLDHSLRGEESRWDADFVREFCAARRLPFWGGSADVKGEVSRCGGSVEEVARRLRYEFLRQVADGVGGALIATGHHRDDQAETVLLNLVRGSGGRGLGAMRPRQGDIVRPLLCLTRAEILTYCSERELQPRSDSSNTDVEFRRNRVRHELAPLLRQRFNPSLTDTLCRTADILADEHDFLRDYVEERLPGWVVRAGGGALLQASVFSQLPVAVQRELLLILLEKLRGDIRGITFAHVEQIRELFGKDRGAQHIDLPGQWQARKSYGELFIEPSPPATGLDDEYGLRAAEKAVAISCPGETLLTDFGFTLLCSGYSGELPPPGELGATRVAFDRASLHFPLSVRRRRPGDRFQPLGAPGTCKLKKLLIDLKIPLERRDSLPIVCDEAGILWVAGCRRSERGRLCAKTRDYIVMELTSPDYSLTGGK